jgi:ribosome-interacting GTPase 1
MAFVSDLFTPIQLLDLPGIIEGAAYGRGRGRQVIAVAKTSDIVIMVCSHTTMYTLHDTWYPFFRF